MTRKTLLTPLSAGVVLSAGALKVEASVFATAHPGTSEPDSIPMEPVPFGFPTTGAPTPPEPTLFRLARSCATARPELCSTYTRFKVTLTA
jgi:hypothetical protein